ncbi:MAG: ABC transporter substrate-binding protein [Pirellulaceae bacterium]
MPWARFLTLGLLVVLVTSQLACTRDRKAEKAAAEFDFSAGLKAFTPPSLEQLNEETEWEDQEVMSPLDRLNAYLAENPPQVDVETALDLRNDSDEANEQIKSGLGIQPSSPDEVNWDATFNHHIGAEVKSVNPLFMSSVYEFEVVGLTNISLIASDWDQIPFGDADHIKSWQTSPDNKIHKFILRDDLKWTDGTPVTAHDFAFTFKILRHPDIILPALSSGTEMIDLVHAYDDHTLVIFHSEPLAINVWQNVFPIIPRHVFEPSIAEDPSMVDSDRHLEMEQQPVTCGPYRLVRRERDKELIFERNEDYYQHNGKEVRNKPYFKTIRMEVINDSNNALLALKSGKIDDTTIAADKWGTDAAADDFYDRNTKVSATAYTEFHIVWNCKSPLFEDARVRRAMSHAVDYREILDRILAGMNKQANGPFHPEAWAHPNPAVENYNLDLDKANQLLDEAGWKDTTGSGIRNKEIDGNNVPLEFSFLMVPSPNSERVARVLQSSFAKVGAKMDIRPIEFTVMQQRTSDHNFDAAFGGWGSGTDPYSTKNIFGTDENRNYGQYSNPEVDKLFEEGLYELDQDERAKIYGKVHTILHEDQPYTWLFYRTDLQAFNKELRGYKMSPSGPFIYNPGTHSIWRAK